MDLTGHQKDLYDKILEEASWSGEDTGNLLIQHPASAEDKAAVADALGGQGAGDEFRDGNG